LFGRHTAFFNERNLEAIERLQIFASHTIPPVRIKNKYLRLKIFPWQGIFQLLSVADIFAIYARIYLNGFSITFTGFCLLAYERISVKIAVNTFASDFHFLPPYAYFLPFGGVSFFLNFIVFPVFLFFSFII
jgi:hypothetical protein